jgi:hypothetical protein
MLKMLLLLTALTVLFVTCSDDAPGDAGQLALAPGETRLAVALDYGDLPIAGLENNPPIYLTKAEIVAQDKNFHPDTVYAADYAVPENSANTLGLILITLLDPDTGVSKGTTAYNFAPLLRGDHVVIFEDGLIGILCDLNN